MVSSGNAGSGAARARDCRRSAQQHDAGAEAESADASVAIVVSSGNGKYTRAAPRSLATNGEREVEELQR